MTSEETNEEQMAESILNSVVRDELKQVPAEIVPLVLDRKPLSAKHEILTTQVAQAAMKFIRDVLVKHKQLNDTIDGLAKIILANPQQWSLDESMVKLTSYLFSDGTINWGRIVALFYTIAKLTGKLLLARLPEPVTKIFSWTLDYFNYHLLQWVIMNGGWSYSIDPITRFGIESVPALCPPKPSSAHAIGITCIIGGIVLGGCVILLLNGRTRH